MTHRWIATLRMTVCAAAVMAAAAASAQTPPPAPAEPAAAPMAPAAGAAPMAPPPHAEGHRPLPPHKRMHHRARHKHKHDGRMEGHERQRGRYASPDAHEAAAAHDNQRRGSGPYRPGAEPGMDQYQRNAFARCEVFKERLDREACVERVRQPGQGSVEGGGILREYTQQVVIDPPPNR